MAGKKTMSPGATPGETKHTRYNAGWTTSNFIGPTKPTNECKIIFAPGTDHSAVTLSLRSKELNRKPGQGFWKFNRHLLEDPEYVSQTQEYNTRKNTKK